MGQSRMPSRLGVGVLLKRVLLVVVVVFWLLSFEACVAEPIGSVAAGM